MQSKSLAVAGLVVVSFASGTMNQYFYPGLNMSPIDLWLLPVYSFLIFWWYYADSIQRGYKRTPWLNIGVVTMAALALPYYFFRSRGLKRGALATLTMLGAFIVSGVLALGGQYATYFALQS